MTNSTDQSTDLTRMFAPIERALLEAFALRTSAPKPLASLRPLMWLACLALAQWLGLAHLITPEMRTAAIELARRPGRRKNGPDSQTSFLDLFPSNDGRPGIYVSLVRLRVGNVRESSGDAALDLQGCHEPSTAIVRAYEQGWVGGPSGNGLRFIPPTVWGLVVDHNSAAFARNGGVDELIESLSSELNAAHERIALLETSIAESARLPIAAKVDAAPCPHKSQTLDKGKRICDECGEELPPIGKDGRVKSTPNSNTKESPGKKPAKRTTKKASKGRAS